MCVGEDGWVPRYFGVLAIVDLCFLCDGLG